VTNKLLFNNKSKKDLLQDLKLENFDRSTFSFYRYVNIDDPSSLRDILYKEWVSLKILGRIYIAKEGINAQLSCPSKNLMLFQKKLHLHKGFENIPLKYAVQDGNSFFKLVIKVKDEIVAYKIDKDEYNMKKVGNHLNPKEFNKAIDDSDSIILDMRNYYESEVGRFEGAIIPNVETSRELLPEIKKILKGKKKNKILMYCTGGIRCEKASSFLIQNGFNDVNQLNGGIINYAHAVKKKKIESKFVGKNFVFDSRLGERITDDIISKCHQCGELSDNHIDCNNDACHLLFIQCHECGVKYDKCCSNDCMDFNKLPIEKQKILRKDPERVVSKTRDSLSGKPRFFLKA
tara:strand:- start:12201 stop:13241 length:1041 start_codon:yes stop_codon:yes gene_type:complete